MKVARYTLFNIVVGIVYLFLFYNCPLSVIDIDIFSRITLIIYILNWIIYLKKFRFESIFCPELLMFLIGMVITFFDVIILSTIEITSSFFSRFSEAMRFKALCLSMVAYSSYILGTIFQMKVDKKNTSRKKRHYHIATFHEDIYNVLTSIMILYMFVSGLYNKYFKYDGVSSDDSLLLYTVILTCMLMVCSVLEFVRLNSNGINSFKMLFCKINKIYLFNITIVSGFLLLSGNRSDMLLIFLPFLILTYYLIKKIKNWLVYTGMVIGILIMALIGLTRNSSEEGLSQYVGVYSIFRDFGAAYINQQGLIWYTDNHGYYGLGMGISTLISSVPYLGGFVLGGSTSSGDVEGNSNEITTREWQSVSNKNSGLGSALLGDLYYAGGIFFVVIYMFTLSFFLSKVYRRLVAKSRVSICALLIYCWFFSDMVYLLRAPYYSLFRFIGFSLVLYLFYKFMAEIITYVSRIKYDIV